MSVETRKPDPNFSGPLEDRGCTDIICCLIFFVALLVYATVSVVAFSYGDPIRLLNPTDSEGNTCGDKNEDTVIGRDLTGKPYLHMFDITKCVRITSNILQTGELACPTTSVCVEECPDTDWSGFFDIAKFKSGNSETIVYSKYLCEYDISAGSGDGQISSPDDLIFGPPGEDGVCGSFYFAEKPLFKRCLPKLLVDLLDTSVNAFNVTDGTDGGVQVLGPVASDGSISPVTGQMLKLVGEATAAFYKAQGIALQVLDDLADSYKMMIAFMFVSCLTVFICIVIMGYLARIVTWTLLVAVHAALVAGCYFSYVKYNELKDEESEADRPDSYNIKVNFDYFTGLYKTWLYLGIACAVLFALILLLTCFMFNRIRLAILILGEAGQAVRSMIFALFFPLIPWIFAMILILYFVVLTVYVASYKGDAVFKIGSNGTNDTQGGTSCEPQISYTNVTINDASGTSKLVVSTGNCYFQEYLGADRLIYIHVFNVFMTLWLVNFVIALGQCTLAGGFASWFWTRGSPGAFPLLKSMYRCFRYHIGSLAFGAFLLALVQLIRIVLAYIDKKLKKKKNHLAKYVKKCVECLFWCFEKFIKFINKNAYIVIAVYGRNFCFSAMDAFFLLTRNIARVAAVNGISAFLIFTCKMAITAGIGVLTFVFFSGQINDVEDFVPDLNFYFTPIIVVVAATFVVATIFFDVYDMAVDTIFFCVLEDLEKHKGTPDSPYFMSKSLQSLLGAENNFTEGVEKEESNIDYKLNKRLSVKSAVE